MAARKTVAKTGQFQKGLDPRRAGGKKGRSGRKKIDFIRECERIVDNILLPKLREKIESGKPDDPAFRWASEKVLDYSKSKAPVRTELSGMDGAALTIRVVRDDKL
jgi:hypothetical protein